jgi:hypothetical protein
VKANTMANHEQRAVAGGCAGGLVGAILGAALPIAYFLVVEGGRSGPTAGNFIATIYLAGLGAFIGACVGLPVGVAIAAAMSKPKRPSRDTPPAEPDD